MKTSLIMIILAMLALCPGYAGAEENGESGLPVWEAYRAEISENAGNGQAENGDPQAYIIHVEDQDGLPVEEVMVNFCTDKACMPRESDADGLITFDGAPAVYHVQIVDAPEGYSYDEEFEMYTEAEYGEWILRVRRD